MSKMPWSEVKISGYVNDESTGKNKKIKKKKEKSQKIKCDV